MHKPRTRCPTRGFHKYLAAVAPRHSGRCERGSNTVRHVSNNVREMRLSALRQTRPGSPPKRCISSFAQAARSIFSHRALTPPSFPSPLACSPGYGHPRNTPLAKCEPQPSETRGPALCQARVVATQPPELGQGCRVHRARGAPRNARVASATLEPHPGVVLGARRIDQLGVISSRAARAQALRGRSHASAALD